MKRRPRCAVLSSRLVQTWNRRTAVELELRNRKVMPSRRVVLEGRLRELCAEQDTLEAQMTRAAALLGEDA